MMRVKAGSITNVLSRRFLGGISLRSYKFPYETLVVTKYRKRLIVTMGQRDTGHSYPLSGDELGHLTIHSVY